MVGILQALKVTLFWFIPLTASLTGIMFSLVLLLNGNLFFLGGLGYFFANPIGTGPQIAILVGSCLIFFFFLIKAIGDITEAALIE
jgi:hypothetical protein